MNAGASSAGAGVAVAGGYGPLHQGSDGRQVAFSPDLGHATVDKEVADLVRHAAVEFASQAGFTLQEVVAVWGPTGPELARRFWSAHRTRLAKLLPEAASGMDPGLVACIRAGGVTTMPDYQDLRTRKHAYIAAIHSVFEEWDFLITPAVSVPAFPIPAIRFPHWPANDCDWMSWAEETPLTVSESSPPHSGLVLV